MPPRYFKAFFLIFPTWHSAFNDPINHQSAAPLTLSFWRSLGSRNLLAPTTSFFPRVMGPLYMVTGVNKNPTYSFFLNSNTWWWGPPCKTVWKDIYFWIFGICRKIKCPWNQLKWLFDTKRIHHFPPFWLRDFQGSKVGSLSWQGVRELGGRTVAWDDPASFLG